MGRPRTWSARDKLRWRQRRFDHRREGKRQRGGHPPCGTLHRDGQHPFQHLNITPHHRRRRRQGWKRAASAGSHTRTIRHRGKKRRTQLKDFRPSLLLLRKGGRWNRENKGDAAASSRFFFFVCRFFSFLMGRGSVLLGS